MATSVLIPGALNLTPVHPPAQPKGRGKVKVGEQPPAGNAYLSFTGVGFSSGVQRSFQAVAGQKPPTITGGYAKWTPVERPLSRALTIFAGYDPMEMTVDVIFGNWTDGWQTDDASGQAVEAAIGQLEWMGGSNFTNGPSPVVYVFCSLPSGGQSDLIPPEYQSTARTQYPWIITGLQWGQAWRNENMFRVWQEATITLQNYLNIGAPPKAQTSAKGGYFISRAGRDRPILIAGAPSTLSPVETVQALAGRILSDPKNNPCKGSHISLSGKGLRFLIRHGTPVWVPDHQVT